MDALRLQSKTLHTTFTKMTKAIREEIRKRKQMFPDLANLNSLLYDKSQRLESTHHAIFELLLVKGDEKREKG